MESEACLSVKTKVWEFVIQSNAEKIDKAALLSCALFDYLGQRP